MGGATAQAAGNGGPAGKEPAVQLGVQHAPVCHLVPLLEPSCRQSRKLPVVLVVKGAAEANSKVHDNLQVVTQLLPAVGKLGTDHILENRKGQNKFRGSENRGGGGGMDVTEGDGQPTAVNSPDLVGGGRGFNEEGKVNVHTLQDLMAEGP